MAYVGSTNNTMTLASISQDICYAVKTALVAAGWTVQGSSNGTTWNNTASGDNLLTYAAWGTAGSWVRLREPSGVGGREYVFMRGTGAGLIIKYSRSVGFATGGGPTTLPTTGASGDGIVWWGSSVGFSATGTGTNAYDQAVTTTAQQNTITGIASGYLSCVASDTAINGVYGFWLIAYAYGTAALQLQLFADAVAVGSHSPLDNDPSYRQFSGGNYWANDLSTNNLCHYWFQYPSPWVSPTTANYRINAPNFNYYLCGNTTMTPTYASWTQPQGQIPALSPYNNKIMTYPILICPPNSGVINNSPKGFSTGFALTYSNGAPLEVIDITSASPRIIFGAGGPIGGLQCVSIPWVTNVQPLV